MPDTLLMSDLCLVDLAKRGEEFDDKAKLSAFLSQWLDLDAKCVDEIFACLCRSSSHGNPESLPTRAKRKAVLKAARISKKLKGMDDPVLAEASRITALRDQWMINNNKMNPALKARMKKAKEVEQKQQAQLDKTRQKAQEKAHFNDIRRLAIGNRQSIGAFKDIFSDPASVPSSPPLNATAFVSINQTPTTRQSIDSMLAKKSQQKAKKQAFANRKANTICGQKAPTTNEKAEDSDKSVTSKASRASQRRRNSTPPPVQMELIRPGKRKVKVTPNAIENTP